MIKKLIYKGEINGVKYPYNDFDVIEKFLKNNK